MLPISLQQARCTNVIRLTILPFARNSQGNTITVNLISRKELETEVCNKRVAGETETIRAFSTVKIPG